jgi:putative glycosyltransferase (TIGR04372 family)
MCPSFKRSLRTFKNSTLHLTKLLLQQTALLFIYIPFVPFRHKFLDTHVIPYLNIGLYDSIHKVSFQSSTNSFLSTLSPATVNERSFSLAFWLTATLPQNSQEIALLENIIKSLTSSHLPLLRSRCNYLYPFTLCGDYVALDHLLLCSRNHLNHLLDRNPGFYGECSHFLAIGHMCLFFYFVRSSLNSSIVTSDLTIIFHYLPSFLPNELLCELLIQYCKNSRVVLTPLSLQNPHDTFNPAYDHELEVWPTVSDGVPSSLLARHHFQDQGIQTDIHSNSSFLPINSKLLEEAEKIIRPYLTSLWFAGLHFRSAQDGRSLRNTSSSSIATAIELIASNSGQSFVFGPPLSIPLSLQSQVVHLRSISKNRHEYELLQLYVWSTSRFVCGSQSGGTLPPSLFGTPILWLDYHPSSHVTWLNPLDIYIPRSIYSVRLRRHLTYTESVSSEHKFCQAECPRIARTHGYRVQPSPYELIAKGVRLISNSKHRSSSQASPKFIS